MKLTTTLPVYLPDTRGIEISPYGRGNLKIGPSVYTYSRLPGQVEGTCPGSTPECESICYAKRIGGVVRQQYVLNSRSSDVPPLPADCRLLRIHVSGDFDTPEYILNWVARLKERPDVRCWAYTRSWRCHSLLEFLEQLRALPNMQLFASMDASTPDLPPSGWRRAWIDGDRQASWNPAHATDLNQTTFDGVATYVCPEEVGRKRDCESCQYCFAGQHNDVTFLRH